MKYALIHDNKIQIGPRNWTYTAFFDFLSDKSINTSTLPLSAPNTAIVTSEYKILPVYYTKPIFNQRFQALQGPFYQIEETYVSATYSIVDQNIDIIKAELKSVVSAQRYSAETSPLLYTFADGETVQLFTSREDRRTYLDILLALPDNESIMVKYYDGKFKLTSKKDIAAIVNLGRHHIASVFAWEEEKYKLIDSAQTIVELKGISVVHPLMKTSVEVESTIPDGVFIGIN